MWPVAIALFLATLPICLPNRFDDERFDTWSLTSACLFVAGCAWLYTGGFALRELMGQEPPYELFLVWTFGGILGLIGLHISLRPKSRHPVAQTICAVSGLYLAWLVTHRLGLI